MHHMCHSYLGSGWCQTIITCMCSSQLNFSPPAGSYPLIKLWKPSLTRTISGKHWINSTPLVPEGGPQGDLYEFLWWLNLLNPKTEALRQEHWKFDFKSSVGLTKRGNIHNRGILIFIKISSIVSHSINFLKLIFYCIQSRALILLYLLFWNMLRLNIVKLCLNTRLFNVQYYYILF